MNAAIREPAPGEVVLDADPDHGFVVLALRQAPFVKPREFAAATRSEELARVWRDWEIPGPVPTADFEKYTVLLFTELELCSGGLGRAELAGLVIDVDGGVRFQLAPDPGLRCGDPEPLAPTVLYAVAVARARLPRPRSVDFRGVRPACRPAGDRPVVASRDRGDPERTESFQAHVDSVLAPPAPGRVSLAHLADGAPVFVVRHRDGSLDVVAADVPSTYDVLQDRRLDLHGLRETVRWNAAIGRFESPSGRYDEYGVPVLALEWRSIDLYRWSLAADGSITVAPGARRPGYGPRPIAPSRAVARYGEPPYIEPFADRRPVALSDAARMPLDTWALVDAGLDVAPGRARLCATWAAPHGYAECAGAGVPALGVTWSPGPPPGLPAVVWMHGPFAGRVGKGGLEDVVKTNWFGPYYDDRVRRGGPSIRLETSVAALGAIGPNADASGAVGVEGAVGVRASPWRDHSAAGFVLGDLAVDVRVRGLASPASGAQSLFAGVAVFFEQHSRLRSWQYPSWASLIVPEVGVGRTEGRTFPYVTWSVPVAFRFESPLLRRHPYDARDVLGVRVAPFVTVPAPASDWIAGATWGLTIW